MFKAIAITFLIFAILFSGMIALKRSANIWKIPKDVKPQPYDDEEDEQNQRDHNNEPPQLENQSPSSTNTDTKKDNN